MTQLPANVQEAIRSVLKGWKLGTSKMVPWERMESDITEALLPVFEAQVEAAEEAQDAECIRDVVRLIRNCAQDLPVYDSRIALAAMAEAIENSPRDKESRGALMRHDALVLEEAAEAGSLAAGKFIDDLEDGQRLNSDKLSDAIVEAIKNLKKGASS